MLSDNNTSIIYMPLSSRSIIITLDHVHQHFVIYLPLVFTILGLIGFIGNAFTFLQPTLRYNTCCIYSLCGSLIDAINLPMNLLPNYIHANTADVIALITKSHLCKLKLFGLVFLPQLSMNLLILCSIDRYICTCNMASPIQRIRQLKLVPYLIGITVSISGLISLYAPLLYDVIPNFGCVCIAPILNGILYISIHGLLTPFVMLLSILLTYRNIKKSRQRVGTLAQVNRDRSRNQFITMIFTQILVTSFFTLQWICFHIFNIITQFDNKSPEQWAIHYFGLSLTNKLYYIINVKSFYLSTLTSRRFRNTFIMALMKIFHQHPRQRNIPNTLSMITAKNKTTR